MKILFGLFVLSIENGVEAEVSLLILLVTCHYYATTSYYCYHYSFVVCQLPVSLIDMNQDILMRIIGGCYTHWKSAFYYILYPKNKVLFYSQLSSPNCSVLYCTVLTWRGRRSSGPCRVSRACPPCSPPRPPGWPHSRPRPGQPRSLQGTR